MEREGLILAATVSGIALLLVIVILFISQPSGVEEANQVGEAGEHLRDLVRTRGTAGFGQNTPERGALDNAIRFIVNAINRVTQRTPRQVRQRDIHVKAPAGSQVIVNPPPGQPPQEGGQGQYRKGEEACTGSEAPLSSWQGYCW